MSGLPPAPPPLLPYNKPWLSYQDQIALLQSRGMAVHDVPAAIEFLRHVNYYRFSGYCLVFEAVRHAFNPGTTFEQVRAAYEFDTTLRDIVTEALEVVEVDLRSAVAYWFGEQYGAFGHTNAANFYHRFHHPNWQNDLQRETRRSTELYVSHFKATYTGFPNLPVWVVPELMSFGVLSRMFQGMLKVDRKAVAANYGVQPDVLESWLHHLSYVRKSLCPPFAALGPSVVYQATAGVQPRMAVAPLARQQPAVRDVADTEFSHGPLPGGSGLCHQFARPCGTFDRSTAGCAHGGQLDGFDGDLEDAPPLEVKE